jgi:hypothetical protein
MLTLNDTVVRILQEERERQIARSLPGRPRREVKPRRARTPGAGATGWLGRWWFLVRLVRLIRLVRRFPLELQRSPHD